MKRSRARAPGDSPRPVSTEYARQVRELLSLEPPIDERGRKGAHVLAFAPQAAERFDTFREQVERMLGPDGDLSASPVVLRMPKV